MRLATVIATAPLTVRRDGDTVDVSARALTGTVAVNDRVLTQIIDNIVHIVAGLTFGGGGVTDHGALTGLGDDDHLQYHTNARGDVRYYTKSQVDTSLAGKANTSHTHAAGDLTSGTVAFARLPTGTTSSTVAIGNHSHGGVSGERIATTVVTSDNVTTAEEVVASVVAPVVAGRTYKITFDFAWQPNAANDQAFARLREDSLTGAEIQLRRLTESSDLTFFAARVETEFTATLTQDKTFVATLARTPLGTATLNATAGRPTFLYVDFIR